MAESIGTFPPCPAYRDFEVSDHIGFPSIKYSCFHGRHPVNAFSTELWREYGQLFDSLIHDGYDVRAAVLSSALTKVFTAGVDCECSFRLFHLALKERSSAVTDFGDGSLGNGEDGARAAFQTRKAIDEFHQIARAPERAPFPVIVALHGHVIGMGIDLIVACDIRYAASNTNFSIKVGSWICHSSFPVNI